MSSPDDGTTSAVPADLRAYSRAAIQIDEQIRQLAIRLGRVLDAYRATNPEFGSPIPRIEDDLARYARFCLEVDQRVGRIADAFERAGTASPGGSRAPADQPVVVGEMALAAALTHDQTSRATPARPKEHHDHSLFGGLLDAVEHPTDTLGHMASAVESTLATGAEDAGSGALKGLEALGGGLLHGIEQSADGLASAEQAAKDFMTGFAAGARDMAEAAALLARVVPGTPLWAASMAIDPVGTQRLQQQFARGLVHMATHPGEALGTMVDIKDLEAGNLARWTGHLTPDVVVTLLTACAGGAVAGAGEGLGEAAVAVDAEKAIGAAEGVSRAAELLAHAPQIHIPPEVELTASERAAAEYWRSAGHDVAAMRPAGSQGIRNLRTADLDVSRVGYVDVYAPKPTTSANGIVRAILDKSSQTSVVHVEIEETSVPEADLIRIPNRVFGNPSAGRNIERILIRYRGRVIVDSVRQ